jgi:class 3 adenylate cyclase/tetratricopeptide (TPR) repeat protein
MLCASCGRDNREGATFCLGCGASLVLSCPGCGKELPSGARFCDSCGQAISEPAAPPTRTPTPTIPTSFAAGRYQVKRFLGEGGRKQVYLAHDTRLDRDVAIAFIKTEGLDAAGLARVRREAQAMGRLGDHPHIVTVFDIGDEGGQPYIVSQYMAGGDLEGLLQQAENHRLPIEQAVRIANEVRQALEYAHGRGIIHRDIKPGNIWLTEDGTAKLGDFGLAMALEHSRLTVEGMMVGTVAYMPPEQALGRKADARSDLYSWGCVLYEMVTGRPPFLGDDAVSIISQHINTAPVAPTWHNPEVPRALESLILRCLAKDPNERPESAAAMPEAMQAVMATASSVAERVVQEEANPLDRLAGGVFVGREKEMDELRAGLEDALSGRGRLLMLVGEPGIGKTRTAEELATYASLRNTQVLWGRCYEGEGAPAYWPWVQVIRSYVHDRDSQALMSEMGPGAADIAQVVSEVRERLPGLPTPPALEPEQARFRLFDSITTFLKNAGNRQPIVLVLDDLHWADKPSLLLLQFLARELRGARLMVLGNYRDVELRREHPLADTLGELTREQLSERILLRGLTERDVARFIELTAGRKPPEALVDAVYKETEGNPFFVNEIVRLLVADRRLERPEEVKSWSVTIPQGVREVVGRRLNHLSRECNSVLTIASVIGREFSLDALDRVSGVKGDRLLEALEEAVAARVLNEVPRTVGRYSFSHALMRETLYEELTTTRRVRLHRQIGEVLEGLYGAHPEPHLAELAYHFCEGAQAGDVDKAIDYAVRAGQRATALLAYEEATNHYERALQTLELMEPVDEAQRCELLLAMGDAQMKAGDTSTATDTFLTAVDLSRTLKDPQLLARSAVGLGEKPVVSGVVDEVVTSLLEEALRALGDEDSSLRARVLARLGMESYFSDARERMALLSREAVEVARRVGDPAALAYALNVSLWAVHYPLNVEDHLAAAAEVVRLAGEANDKEMALSGHYFRLLGLLMLGDLPAVDMEIETYSRLAEELRQPLYMRNAFTFRAMRALLVGRFQEGERLAQQGLAMGRRVDEQTTLQFFGIHMFVLRWLQGALAEADVVAARAFAVQYPTIPAFRCALAFFCSELGLEAEARTEFEHLVANDFANLPRDANFCAAISLLSAVCWFLGDRRRAAKLYELLLPYARCTVVVGAVVASLGAASHFLGLLAATMSRWDQAIQHFEDALEMNARMRAKPRLAVTQYEYASVLVARNQAGDPSASPGAGREKALDLLTHGLDTAQELGMKALVAKALALKLRAQGVLTSGGVHTSIDAVAAAVYVDKPDLRPHAAPDGTVTILFTDIEGSTEMTERLGDRRWLELLRAHNAIVRERVQAHGGFEVKSQGDGFMLAFGSARRAVQCAIDIQRAFAQHNEEQPEEPIRVRIGLHTGEAIKEAQDFYGRHVILASRVADQAEGGQILVSSLLKELTESAGDLRFGDRREVELKGLKGKHQVFGVAWE